MIKSNFEIILYGGPGSGKGTQAGLLLNKLKATTLNMGAELRKAMTKQDAIGREIAKYINAGKIAPLRISQKIIESFLNSIPSHKRIVFDGYPRTMGQVKTLDVLMAKTNRKTIFVYIKLPMNVAMARLKKRAVLEGRSDDINPVAIKNRIDIFNTQAKKIIRHYQQSGQLVVIDGDGSIADVHKRIIKAISQ